MFTTSLLLTTFLGASPATRKVVTFEGTSNTVRTRFKGDTEAQVMAYADVGHFFSVGGVTQEWTVVIRYTHDLEKTAEGWRIRRVMLDPIHFRGNPLGLDLVKGKRLV